MLRALLAYLSVLSVSIKSRSDGEQQAIISVRLLPIQPDRQTKGNNKIEISKFPCNLTAVFYRAYILYLLKSPEGAESAWNRDRVREGPCVQRHPMRR